MTTILKASVYVQVLSYRYTILQCIFQHYFSVEDLPFASALPMSDIGSEGKVFISAITRLVISRDDLPKIAGIGGQTLVAIRDKTGGQVKVVDLPNSIDEKMVVLGGQMRQVIDAFDLITEVLPLVRLNYSTLILFCSVYSCHTHPSPRLLCARYPS